MISCARNWPVPRDIPEQLHRAEFNSVCHQGNKKFFHRRLSSRAMATDNAPVMVLFNDEDVRVAFGDGAETQLPQAVIEHSTLLKEMQVRALRAFMTHES